MNNIAEINAEMARISEPIDMANDEFSNLFKQKSASICIEDPMVGDSRSKGREPLAKKAEIASPKPFTNVLHVSLASVFATISFSVGVHLSGVAQLHSSESGTALVSRYKNIDGNVVQQPRVKREEKQTVIRRTYKRQTIHRQAALSGGVVRHTRKLQSELPQAISVPLANIVALAYGRTNDEFEENFPSKEAVIVSRLANDDWLEDWPVRVLSAIYKSAGVIGAVFETASFVTPNEDKGQFSQSPKGKCGTAYQVQQGQTLEVISQEIYGTPDKWRQLFYVNRHMIGGSPTYLVVGQILKVPCGDVRMPAVRQSSIKKKRFSSRRKQYRRVRTYVRVKKSHGNRLITITSVRRR